MSTDSLQIFDDALSLPESLRSQLADQLLISLAPAGSLSDVEWRQELLKRIELLEQGKLETVSGEECLAELREFQFAVSEMTSDSQAALRPCRATKL